MDVNVHEYTICINLFENIRSLNARKNPLQKRLDKTGDWEDRKTFNVEMSLCFVFCSSCSSRACLQKTLPVSTDPFLF